MACPVMLLGRFVGDLGVGKQVGGVKGVSTDLDVDDKFDLGSCSTAGNVLWSAAQVVMDSATVTRGMAGEAARVACQWRANQG